MGLHGGAVRMMSALRLSPTKALFLAALGLLSGGCGTEVTTVGGRTYLYKTPSGQEVLTTLPCGNAADSCNERYRSATITNNSADEEFWQFERSIQVRAAIGIPYGRRPQDVNVIGTREQCEAVRSRVKDAMAEPCKGPFYFHRDESK
jgi:hypothetical protein